MKTFFNIVNTLSALMYNFILVLLFVAALAASGFYMNPMPLFIGITILMLRFRSRPSVGNVLFAGTFQDVWVSWLLENFYSKFPFLSKMRNLSDLVANDVINVREIGADPAIWINNNTYPIPTVERTDINNAIELDKFESINTGISLKESQRLDYNKFMSATAQHQKKLMQKAQEKWTYALGAAADTAYTPIITCTGADRGDGTKKMLAADVIKLGTELDYLGTPSEGRILCLSKMHQADLLAEDTARFKALADLGVGKFLDMMGFEIFSSIHTPTYHKSALTKMAFEAAPTGNDAHASIAWHEDEVAYAKGSMTMHYLPSTMNPGTRRDEFGFTMFAIGRPIRNKFLGVAVSGAV